MFANGDRLVYMATKADGDALPPWLSFNPATRPTAPSPDSGPPHAPSPDTPSPAPRTTDTRARCADAWP